MQDTIYSFSTPIGPLTIYCNDSHLISIKFTANSTSTTQNTIAIETEKQIIEYFQHQRRHFELPMATAKSHFQNKLRIALLALPYGSRCDYQTIAKQLNSHPRAVGQALRANPIPIVIPCHRIISKNDLGGFCGSKNDDKLALKQQLLELEAG